MASTVLGRYKCPECGSPDALVQRSAREGARAHRYCPLKAGCGAQYFPKSPEAEKLLLARMTPLADGEVVKPGILHPLPLPPKPKTEPNTSAKKPATVPATTAPVPAPVPAQARGVFSSIFQR